MKNKHIAVVLAILLSLVIHVSATEIKNVVIPENGVYIFDIHGDFYDFDSWNVDNNKDVVGIALITDNTKSLIALENANKDGYVVWGPDGLVGGVVTTESNYSNAKPGVALSDYNGASNTLKEVNQLSPQNNTALYLANAYRFPGYYQGYLPALGELVELFKNFESVNKLLGKVGGQEIEDFWYWSSTQHYLYYRAWAYGITDAREERCFAQLRNESSPLASSYGPCRINVRAFGTIPQTIEVEDDGFGKVADVIDLGLSVKWAAWNIGASQIDEYGGLYGMGDSTGTNLSSSASDYYYEDGISLNETEYDLAYTKWGKDWRLPTTEELKELRDKCYWTHNVTIGDITGSVATGPNGNKLFLPYSGCRHETEIRERGYRASIWSGDAGSPSYSYGFMDLDVCSDGTLQMDGCRNWVGQSIRPVYVNKLEKCATPTISYDKGKLVVNCETEGAECVTTVTSDDVDTFRDNEIVFNRTYIIKAYARAEGYEDSDVAMATICWNNGNPTLGGFNNEELEAEEKVGDVNKDGEVDVADIATIISIMAGKYNPQDDNHSNPQNEYLWLEGNADFYVNFNNSYCNLEYSFDKLTWIEAKLTSANDFSSFTKIPAKTKVFFRGDNGVSNSFWGSDWWGCFRTTTYEMYHSNSKDARFESKDSNGTLFVAGGNMLSVVFGSEFVEKKEATVYSTLSRIFAKQGLFSDASNLYMLPAEYDLNEGRFSSYGNQYGTFQWCHNLSAGPHVKYLSKDLFSDCDNLKEFWYEGDGTETDIAWFNSVTSSLVEVLIIHVHSGVIIQQKPSNAVIVEDL